MDAKTDDKGKCPFMSGAHTNRDWWPNTLNIEVLHKIAEALLDKEVLDGAEIDEIIRAYRGGNGSTALTVASADVSA